MNEARYPSKERVERDGVLVYAEGDDLLNDPDEMRRQGYKPDSDDTTEPVIATERVERDGVLVYAEGDVIDPADEETISAVTKGRTATAPKRSATDKAKS